jgi:hypothetical protein
MYWSRTGSLIDVILWLLLCSLWWFGGWLLSAHAFRLRHRERLFAGGALGLLLFTVFSNLLGSYVPLTLAYWIATFLVLCLGALAAWRSSLRPVISTQDLSVWPEMLAFAGLLLLYLLINRGMAIFDDFSNLPIVSTIAAGDVPPHFYLNPDRILDYHYGLHLFAASLVRIGGFYPWSAFDFSKALVTALAPILAWLWFRRFFNRKLALIFGVSLILFAAGTRWVLLFVPENTMLKMGANLEMLGSAAHTGPDLYSALASPWKIEGCGPIPFPFAFVNGMFSPLLPMASVGALSRMSILLLLLLALRRWQPFPGLIYSLLLASLALVVEHIFVIAWVGILIAILVRSILYRSITDILHWGWVLLPSALLAITMGGVISETASRWLALLQGGASQAGVGLAVISFNWPPTLLSAHLGSLSITDPNQATIALVEMGPVLLLGPWMAWLTGRFIRSRKLVMAGLSIMAVVAFIFPLFFRLAERGRDLSRLTEASLYIWLVLAIPYLWILVQKGSPFIQSLVWASFFIVTLSGIALLPPQLVAIARPQPSYFIQEPDVLMSRAFWNKLDEEAQILDISYPYRPPTLFGRSAGRSFISVYEPMPGFEILRKNPDPIQIAEAGYTHFYIDRKTWQGLSAELRRAFSKPCIKLLAEQKTALGDFRRLYDVHACQKTP